MNDNRQIPEGGGACQVPHNTNSQTSILLPSDGPLWNSQLGRRAFLKKSGAATAATAVALHGFRMQVLAVTTGALEPQLIKEERRITADSVTFEIPAPSTATAAPSAQDLQTYINAAKDQLQGLSAVVNPSTSLTIQTYINYKAGVTVANPATSRITETKTITFWSSLSAISLVTYPTGPKFYQFTILGGASYRIIDIYYFVGTTVGSQTVVNIPQPVPPATVPAW